MATCPLLTLDDQNSLTWVLHPVAIPNQHVAIRLQSGGPDGQRIKTIRCPDTPAPARITQPGKGQTIVNRQGTSPAPRRYEASLISTRRLRARPSAVSLVSIGSALP